MSSTTPAETVRPPSTRLGPWGWLKVNLFSSWFNSLLTLVTVGGLAWVVPRFVRWAFWNALWYTPAEACRAGGGACWSVITKNLRFILFGFYPHPEQWRPAVAMGLLLALLWYSKERTRWSKRLVWLWLVGLPVMGLLMRGGVFGLPVVETEKWSGLPLTLLLSVFGMVAAYPLGVILALGRRSRMPAVKSLCVAYIELIRGVPLISLLFMSSVMFPLFLPEGVTVNKILRALAAIILFTAAYIAEVVRGGLQAIPRGQYEAAESLGLNYVQTMRRIVLPQALKIVIPPTVGVLVSAFKDTSLVVIIGLYEILNTTKSTLSNPQWMGFSSEAYLFLALLYFLGCFSMSSYSRRLERELTPGSAGRTR